MTTEMEEAEGHNQGYNTPHQSVLPKSASSTHTETGDASQTLSLGKFEGSLSPAQSAGPSEVHFPEGGWKAWGCVLGAFFAQFCGIGYTTSFGVYQDFYTRFYITSESPSTISWIGSVDAFLVVSGGLIAGRLYDKGYFQHIKILGSVLIVLSLFTLSLSHPDHIYQNFLAQGVGHGLGAGAMYVPTLAIVSHYFVRRRALAMSIVAAGAPLGAIIHPIMLNHLFVIVGYHNAVRANAGMITGLLIMACILMQPRLPPPTHTPDLWKSVKKFIKDGPYMCAALGMMIVPIGIYYPLFYIQLDSVEHGLGQNFSFYSLVIVNSASVIGRLTPGFLIKYVPVAYMAVLCTALCAILIFALSGVTTIAGFVVFGILYGFSGGAVIALSAPLITVLSDDISELGLRMGIAFALCGLGTLVGPPLDGALLTEKFVWWKPAMLSGSCSVLATILFVMMVWMLHRRQRKGGKELYNYVILGCGISILTALVLSAREVQLVNRE